MFRTMPHSVEDKVRELRNLANIMAKNNNPYAIDVHAIAVDLAEGLNLRQENNNG